MVGFDLVEVSLGGESLTLAHADEPSLRSRGLMQVVELGDLDGMLFSWGGNTVREVSPDETLEIDASG